MEEEDVHPNIFRSGGDKQVLEYVVDMKAAMTERVPQSLPELTEWCLVRLNLQPESLTFEAVQEAYDNLMQSVLSGVYDLVERKELTESAVIHEALNHLVEVKEMVARIRPCIESLVLLQSSLVSSETTVSQKPMWKPWISSFENESTKLKPFQIAIVRMLEEAWYRGFRREGGDVFAQKSIKRHGLIISTHAWERLYSIKDFVYKTADKHADQDTWNLLTQNPGLVRAVTEYLTDCHDIEFPRIQRNRRYIAFRDGVFDVAKDTFYSWGDDRLNSNIMACKYHDLPVPKEWFSEQAMHDPKLIPTPTLDRIWATQDIDTSHEAYDWILAWSIGRCLHDLNSIERNQRNGVLFIGESGTGKSSIAKLLASVYDASDIGQLNSNCEPKYALANLHDKYIWFCTEVKRNFQLDTAMLQLILEGSSVAIQQKYSTAWSENWTVPGLMCGNELPNKWIAEEAAGALLRRFLIVEFPNKPTVVDPSLENDLQSELAAILIKCNRMYLQKARQFQGSSMESFLPAYFSQTLGKFQRKTQPLLSMLDSSSELVRSAGSCISYRDVKSLFKEHCRLNSMRAPQLDDDTIDSVCKTLSLESKTATSRDPVICDGRTNIAGKYIMGLGHAQSFSSDVGSDVAAFGAEGHV